MVDRFTCPHCRREINVPDQFAGGTMFCPMCGQEMSIPSQDARNVPPLYPQHEHRTVQYAGFWIRFVSEIVDSLVLLIPGFIANIALPVLGGTVLWIIYKSLCLANWNGQTVGKKVCNIKVVDESLGPLTPGQAFGRTCGEIVSGIILCIGYIMAAFDERKQSLHDKMAGTLHIYAS